MKGSQGSKPGVGVPEKSPTKVRNRTLGPLGVPSNQAQSGRMRKKLMFGLADLRGKSTAN